MQEQKDELTKGEAGIYFHRQLMRQQDTGETNYGEARQRQDNHRHKARHETPGKTHSRMSRKRHK